MKTNKIIPLILTIGVVGGFLVFLNKRGPTNNNNTSPSNLAKPTEVVTQTGSVPLPEAQDIIRTFFELINEKRIPEAINMMTPTIIGDESSKQAWGVQFNIFDLIKVTEIKPSMSGNWTNNKEIYQVTFNASIKSGYENQPIPNYGYDNGSNVRFITLQKNAQGVWKIAGLGTGP